MSQTVSLSLCLMFVRTRALHMAKCIGRVTSSLTAYDVPSDVEKRHTYDMYRAEGMKQNLLGSEDHFITTFQQYQFQISLRQLVWR